MLNSNLSVTSEGIVAVRAMAPDGERVSVFQAVEALGDITAGKISHPAFRVIEQADGDEPGIRAHIEPVWRVGGDADQVAFGAKYFVNLVVDVQCEQPWPSTKKRTSSSLWRCSSRNFCRNAAFSG